jgi:hypothetical protein
MKLVLIGVKMAEKTWDETVADEIERLHEQADEAAFVRFIEFSDIGKDSGNKTLQIIGLMNAAAIACKLGNYDLCFAVVDSANNIDEEACTKYMQEQPRMYEMMKTLSEAGAFDNG